MMKALPTSSASDSMVVLTTFVCLLSFKHDRVSKQRLEISGRLFPEPISSGIEMPCLLQISSSSAQGFERQGGLGPFEPYFRRKGYGEVNPELS
jgi:hypothetical protein